MAEPVGEIRLGDGSECLLGRVDEMGKRAWLEFAEDRLDLRPSKLDWIEVGRVGGQEDDGCTGFFDGVLHGGHAVCTEVVEHYDIIDAQLGNDAAFDVVDEGRPGQAADHHHGRDQTRSDE